MHLFLAEEIGRDVGQSLAVDTRTKQTTVTLDIGQPEQFAVSPSRRLLAVAPMVRGAELQVLELPNLIVAAQVTGDDPTSWMTEPAWNPAETKLAYVDSYRWLAILTLSDGTTERVLEIPKGDVCYFLGFPRDDLLVHRCGRGDRERPDLVAYDIPSRRASRTLSGDFSSCIVIANGKNIACKVGF